MEFINFIKNSKYMLLVMVIITQTVYCMQDINEQNKFGNTQLHSAAAEGSLKEVHDLLSAGASTNIQNKRGSTPLHRAVFRHYSSAHRPIYIKNMEIIHDLLRAGANPNIQDNEGHTALHLAAYRKKIEIIETILDHPQTNPTLKSNRGQTAAEYAESIQQKVIFDMIQQAIDNYSQHN